MWQTFIYLNWPALAGSPGQPDPGAKFDGSTPVVWQTYKSYDQVFLPNGAEPPAWNQSTNSNRLLLKHRADVAAGRLRRLKQTSKISSDLPKSAISKFKSADTNQADGFILVDQAGSTAYYEMLMNQDEFNYITDPALKLYNADNQPGVSGGINLPSGETKYGPVGAIEVKAAWKILTPTELGVRPIRFLTAQALIGDSTTAVTVGLVGLHVMQRPDGFYQGVWATFSQVDNCPMDNAPGPGPYSFYTPSSTTPVNTQTTPPTPTQVTQVAPVGVEAGPINTCVQNLITNSNPSSPFQFYQLLNVQWPNNPLPLTKDVPLPNGTPNIGTLVNPVLETDLQNQPQYSCLYCHSQFATIAPTAAQPNPTLGASYSFLFGHASSATAPRSPPK